MEKNTKFNLDPNFDFRNLSKEKEEANEKKMENDLVNNRINKIENKNKNKIKNEKGIDTIRNHGNIKKEFLHDSESLRKLESDARNYNILKALNDSVESNKSRYSVIKKKNDLKSFIDDDNMKNNNDDDNNKNNNNDDNIKNYNNDDNININNDDDDDDIFHSRTSNDDNYRKERKSKIISKNKNEFRSEHGQKNKSFITDKFNGTKCFIDERNIEDRSYQRRMRKLLDLPTKVIAPDVSSGNPSHTVLHHRLLSGNDHGPTFSSSSFPSSTSSFPSSTSSFPSSTSSFPSSSDRKSVV